MFKNKTTSYLVKEIPVDLWKSVRARCLTEGHNAAGDVIKSLLSKWIKGDIKDVG